MFCTACGEQNSIDAAFCTKCGARLGVGPQPEGPAAEQPTYAPSFAPHYDYSTRRSYGTGSGSILGWILLIVAAAGLIGCFLPFQKDGVGIVPDNTVLTNLENQKWLLVYPAGFGLVMFCGLMIGLGAGSPKAWMTFCGIGVGLAASAVLMFALSSPSIFPTLAIGAHLLIGSAAVCLIVAVVEGFWPS